jgi:hypothetical protein
LQTSFAPAILALTAAVCFNRQRSEKLRAKRTMKTKFGFKAIVAVLSMGWLLTATVWAQTNQSASSSRLEIIRRVFESMTSSAG